MSSLIKDIYIHDGWQAYQSLPDTIKSPSNNCFTDLPCFDIKIPGSLFSSLATQDLCTDKLDDFDWWYTCDFSVDSFENTSNYQLTLDRLATLAEVWLNGVKLASTNNMFLTNCIDVSNKVNKHNTLIICFRSVNHFLKQRRPRPKWKTNLVNNQQLRWLRTSLLGRMPGWTPGITALGPCGQIKLTLWKEYLLQSTNVSTQVEAGRGTVKANINILGSIRSVQLHVGKYTTTLSPQTLNKSASSTTFSGMLNIEDPQLWWPCTHGDQYLYPCQLVINTNNGDDVIDLGYRAFRSLKLDTADKQLNICINDKKIFARGACWTITDLKTFFPDTNNLRSLLTLAHEANINMLRVGGTMTYEVDEFYNICDELGIMVWQDFMFANMDYPVDDPKFNENICTEVSQQLMRLSQHVCITVYCGNSEVQQQASMVGIEKQSWSNDFFDTQLAQLVTEHSPCTPYFPSTPYGGALPFHIAEGICHFYGVGAYKKSLLASGLKDVKFTAESLGFSNIPEPRKVNEIFSGNLPVCHSPLWKQGVPRDSSAGWDFEDIRDYYIQEMFHIDPVQLRSKDTLRYLAISRAVTGELIKLVISHWRSPETPCSGALIWFYKDLIPGAGWGILDDEGNEKSVYYYLKRAFQPLAAFVVDKGLDGLNALIVNETPYEHDLRLDIKLLSCPSVVIEQHSKTLTIKNNSYWTENIEAIIGHFRDVNFSYQFGMMQHQLVTLQVYSTQSNELLTEDVYFTDSLLLENEKTADITADYIYENANQYLVIKSDRFLQTVYLDLTKTKVSTNYFHLLPDTPRKILIDTDSHSNNKIKGYISALNLSTPIRLSIKLNNEI